VSVLALVVAVAALTLRPAAADHGHRDSGDGSGRVFGLYSPGRDSGFTTAHTTAGALGRHLDVFSAFEAWSFGNSFPTDTLRGIAAAGSVPEITWEPWDPNAGPKQPVYSMERIASGAFDPYINSWADAAAAFGKPMLIRFAHEMTGNWYPWAPATSGESAGAYVSAWRHVHDLFTAAGAHNVRWVWSPTLSQGQRTHMRDVYPGPAYVDIVGFDGYNVGSEKPEWGGWTDPQKLLADTIASCSDLAPGKPLWINEIGSTEHGGDKAAWITALFDYLRTTRVKGVIWFDSVADNLDYRLSTSSSSFGAATSALHNW